MADQDSSIEDDDRLSEEEGERDSSSDDQRDSLADVIASHYLDELDYEELIQSDTPIDPPSFLSDEGVMRKKEEEEEEEGELLSDEEEIKNDAVPTVVMSTADKSDSSRKSSPITTSSVHGHSHIRTSPTPQQLQSGSVCRHFLQGRCSWGEECRFSHALPPDYHPPRNLSPQPSLPRAYPSHPRPPHLTRPPRPRLPHLMGAHSMHPMFQMRFPPPVPVPVPVPPPSFDGHLYPPHPLPPLPPHPSSLPPWGEAMVIEKEESGGWLRVRTIMGGAYTPEEEEEKNSRHKLPMKQKQNSKGDSDDGESHKKTTKRTTTERPQYASEIQLDSAEHWMDPWSRGRQKHEEEEEKEDEEERVEEEEEDSEKLKKKKGKHKDKKKKTKKHKKKKKRTSDSDGGDSDGDESLQPSSEKKRKKHKSSSLAESQLMIVGGMGLLDEEGEEQPSTHNVKLKKSKHTLPA